MKKKIKSLLCDLDGVLTNTAGLHARAWKSLFDEVLQEESSNGSKQEFDVATDYPEYVDGKPRLEGIRSYVKAKGLDIPEGDEDDAADARTVHGLGRKKNQLFHELLDAEGVDVFPESIQALREWKGRGLKIAVVSASKNCRSVLQSAGITDLFEVIVDGIVAQEKNLAGKPAPDTFLYAARLLQSDPGETAVAEDAASGIKAAKRGQFALAIGVAQANNAELLQQHEADVIVENLGKMFFTGETLRYAVPGEKLELADWCGHHFERSLSDKNPVFFFDYDGTLTPIVDHPEDALLAATTKEKLERLAQLAHVAVISGRDKDDVKKLVSMENLFYAGSHGFDIEGPGNNTHQLPGSDDIIHSVEKATRLLQERLQKVEGAHVEPKKFAVAVHYRNTPKEHWQEVKEICRQTAETFSNLKTTEGKMVVEIRPEMNWDKGKAMAWVADKLNVQSKDFHHFYIGDDITDEDAFKALPENGTGILVGLHENNTYADYRLNGPGEIERLLDCIIAIIQKQKSNG